MNDKFFILGNIIDAHINSSIENFHKEGMAIDSMPLNCEGFCPDHLGHWIKLCEQAHVPHIPAELIAGFRNGDHFEAIDGVITRTMQDAFDRISQKVSDNEMIRLACCSMAEVKYRLSIGEHEWISDFKNIMFDDPRLIDILAKHPFSWVKIYKRPWVDLEIYKKYPIEFRAYVRENNILGISNYYIQRDLPNTPEILSHTSIVERLAEKLIDAQKQDMFFPAMKNSGWDMSKNSWTADFAVTKSKDIVFIEGGPPYGAGADPCCFEDVEIDGIKLNYEGSRNAY